MTIEELNNFAEQEAQWLQYYGYLATRKDNSFSDGTFYDTITTGYAKRPLPLYRRCPACLITCNKPTLTASVEELIVTNESIRDHSNNVYTPLEYVLINNVGNHEQLRAFLKQ